MGFRTVLDGVRLRCDPGRRVGSLMRGARLPANRRAPPSLARTAAARTLARDGLGSTRAQTHRHAQLVPSKPAASGVTADPPAANTLWPYLPATLAHNERGMPVAAAVHGSRSS